MLRLLRTYIVALHAVAMVMVFAIATPCQAQGGCFNCGCPACAGGGGGYQGPGDVFTTSPYAWFVSAVLSPPSG